MKYKVRRQGIDLGFLSLEEVRRRRGTGEFTGNEYVQCDGATDWQPLDLVLRQGYQATPPQIPKQTTHTGLHPALIVGAVLLGVLLFGGFILFGVRSALNSQQRSYTAPQHYGQNTSAAAVAASKSPIAWTTNTSTMVDENRRAREFCIREWLDGYQQRGVHNPESDAEAVTFLQTWIARNYGGGAATNELSLEAAGAKLTANARCNDPLVLTVAGLNLEEADEGTRLLERALALFPVSQHRAYPALYAQIMLAQRTENRPGRMTDLETGAVPLLKKCFNDGSFTPGDQQEIGEIFVNGWASGFFRRHSQEVCDIIHAAGPDYHWLALTLDGEREINVAWAARGSGYANSVSDQGWKSFSSHLAAARKDLTTAWNLQPAWPLAPERMIYVSLGDADINEMRTWFDNTTTAQIDYNSAWKDFRWGLRPRWYGNEKSLLAIGVAAINTGRFDTDVPRKYLDAIYDVESEMTLPAGRHIFGRDDIWPDLEKMYDGYINAPSQAAEQKGWRSSFAAVAYFAGKYDEARTQLEALDWKPQPENLTGWGADLSSMPLEVAARTGPLGIKISAAEAVANQGDPAGAFKKYQKLAGENSDPRTQQFIQLRLSQLGVSQKLAGGNWVNFLPTRSDDPDWTFNLGRIQPQADGSVLAKSTAKGYVFYCRTVINTNFEVRGQFEIVHTSEGNSYQTGLNFGDTSEDRNNWCSFRFRRRDNDDSISFGRRWTSNAVTRPARLNDTTNTFDFIFQNGCVTASVNGTNVFNRMKIPEADSVTGNAFTLGLGALARANAVIRYRDIQLRNLN